MTTGLKAGWQAEANAGTLRLGEVASAQLVVEFPSPIRIQSIRFTNAGCGRIVIYAVGENFEKTSYIGGAPVRAGANSLGNSTRIASLALTLPTSGMTLLAGRGEHQLALIAGQSEWTGLRIEVQSHSSAQGQPFGLKRFEVMRHLSSLELAESQAERTAQAARASQPPPLAPLPPRPVPRPAAAQAAPTTAPVRAVPHSALPARPAPLKRTCQCSRPDCNGCGPPCKKARCMFSNAPSLLLTSGGKAANKGRYFWKCKQARSTPSGRLYRHL